MCCVDVDECLSDNGGCSEICVNLPGSYTCACGTGKEISEDKRNCTVVGECVLLICAKLLKEFKPFCMLQK